jgi:S-adenosylmethionine hydrolase
VRIGTAVIKEIHETFGQAKPGSLVVLLDSNDHLSINLVNGNASNILNAQVGDQVNVILA